MEQVVPEREMGKPFVSSFEIAFIRKWASPCHQSVLIQTYRMRRQRCFELPGELALERSGLYPVQLLVWLGKPVPH